MTKKVRVDDEVNHLEEIVDGISSDLRRRSPRKASPAPEVKTSDEPGYVWLNGKRYRNTGPVGRLDDGTMVGAKLVEAPPEDFGRPIPAVRHPPELSGRYSDGSGMFVPKGAMGTLNVPSPAVPPGATIPAPREAWDETEEPEEPVPLRYRGAAVAQYFAALIVLGLSGAALYYTWGTLARFNLVILLAIVLLSVAFAAGGIANFFALNRRSYGPPA